MLSLKYLWLDCDPGLDDTLAIIMAAHHPELNLLGISTSAGNTNINNTTNNALDILFNVGKEEIPVIKGASKPMKGQSCFSEHMHGQNGLGGVQLPHSKKEPIITSVYKHIADIIMNSPEQIIWANTGSLTNLAILLQQHPQVKKKIDKIVIMGGAIGVGNITPAAEFNIYFDAFAANQVFQLKDSIPLIMIPLQLTHQVIADDNVMNKLLKMIQYPLAKSIYNMLNSYKKMYNLAYGLQNPPIHDPCVIYYCISTDQFLTKKVVIQIDIYPISYGRTNCYFKINNQIVKSIDQIGICMINTNKFWDEIFIIFTKIFIRNKQQIHSLQK